MADKLRALPEEDDEPSRLVFNGINAVTGNYGQPPLSPQQLVRLIRGSPIPQDYREFVDRQRLLAGVTDLEDRLTRVTDIQSALQESHDAVRLEELRFKAATRTPYPVKPGAGDPSRVEDVGWAVMFPADMHPRVREEIKDALQPLLELRREQAGDLFRIYEGGDAYRAGERKDQAFERLGVGPGLVDPQEMPFYVLLIGTPEEIPYGFQYQIDVMRGVGRLDFGTDIEAYARYAQNIVACETGRVALARRAAFFAPENPGDKATKLSSQYLVQPLYENLTLAAPDFELPLADDWDILPPYLGEGRATHDQLTQLLGGDPAQTPALLFSASHGIEFPAGHPAQLRQQGALLCQDWPGVGRDVLRDFYFAGEDIVEGADLLGMMAFFFACYGAGTPQLDQFAAQAFKVREKIAPRGFTAALPQQMLKQGALAVLGHVERAWGYSFISPTGRMTNQSFVTAMRMLMNGEPVGLATDASFDMRYAELSSDLSADLEELKWDPGYMDDYELANRWTANNDARSYVVIGDPAARIPFARPEPPSEEGPDIGTITVPEPEAPEAPGEVEQPVDSEAEGTEEQVSREPPVSPEEEETATTTEEFQGGPSLVVPEPVAQDVAYAVPPPIPAATPSEAKVYVSETVETFVSEQGRVPVVTAPVDQAARPWAEAELKPKPREPISTAPGITAMTDAEVAVAFGLADQFERLRESLRAFTDQLATSLGHAAEDIVTLDVKTYSTDDIARVAAALETHEDYPATLRALTRVAFDGDLEVYVPEKSDRDVDIALWEIHKSMVEEAQDSRSKFLATMAELATRLLDSLKIGSV